MNLQWQAIDLNRQVLVVMRSRNGEKRTVPLNGRLTELLQRKSSKKTTGSLVFASSAETLFDGRNLTRAFRLAAKKAELSDFRFHELRHTFATRLVDLYKVQRLLGHKTAAMSQRYAHHSPESLREGVLILERVHPQISQKYHNEGASFGGCCASA